MSRGVLFEDLTFKSSKKDALRITKTLIENTKQNQNLQDIVVLNMKRSNEHDGIKTDNKNPLQVSGWTE